MATRADLFPSKYVKHSDLDGGEIVVTIAGLDMEEVGTDREEKPVLKFKGAKKGLVLNVTNYDEIALAYGEETDGWAGKKIKLYPDKTRFGGKLVDCVRVRAEEKPKTTAAALEQHPDKPTAEAAPAAGEPEFDDSIPF